jgi:chromosome segregation ATPase
MNMDKTFLGILENHVQEINKSVDSKGTNDILLKTIKLLLDKIDYSKGILASYSDKIEMRKLFSSFGRVAQSACDFYQASKDNLDPAALNGEIGRKLEAATQEVTKVNALLENIEKNNIELFKQEKELNKINEKYEKRKETVSKLKSIKETVSDDVIKSLEREESELDKNIKQNQKRKSELDSQIKKLEDTSQSLQKSVAKANAEKKAIEENVIETIDSRLETIKNIYAEHSRDLDNLKAEIEDFKRKYNKLDEERVDVKEEHDFYNLHLGENSNIVKKLKEYGISGIDDFFIETTRLKEYFEKELTQFDKLIREVLVKQEEIKEDIGRRNGTLS